MTRPTDAHYGPNAVHREPCIYCYGESDAKDMTFIGGGYGHGVCHARAVAEARSMTREDWESEYRALEAYDKQCEEYGW